MTTKPIAILEPTPDESPGTLTEAFALAGLPVRLIAAYRGAKALPPVGELAGTVVLGGTMSVRDCGRHPFLQDVIDWLRRAAELQRPVLGICLGSQLLAAALGAEVRAHHTKEIGWYDVELTAEGRDDPLLANCSRQPTVFQWHGDTFDLPAGAVQLAKSATCDQQSFRFGHSVYGVQFHPEVTQTIIERWVNEPAGRAEIDALNPSGADADAILARLPERLPGLERTAAQMFARFAALCRNHAHPSASPDRVEPGAGTN